MPSVDESINELQSVRGSIDSSQNQINSASEELEKHQGVMGAASQALEDVAESTDSAADNLEQLISATLALTYRSTAEAVQSAKDRVLQAAVQLRAAKDQVAQAADEVTSVRDSLAESVGTLAESDTAVEEAINRLSSLPLPSGAGSSSSGGISTAHQSPPRMPKNHQRAKPPNNRHHLNRITSTSTVKEENTVILPHVDIAADVDAIKRRQAHWDPETNRFHINGRQYKMESNGTLFPVAGEGTVSMSRQSYKALRGVIEAGGDRRRLPRHLTSNPNISNDDWDQAFEVFRHHERSAESDGEG